MIYRFKLVSDEVNNFSRVIEIDSGATFMQLREAILDSVNFSSCHLDTFLLCDDEWEAYEEIEIEDNGLRGSDRDVWLMEDTYVDRMLDDEGQKLMFMFDNLNNRCFFLELREVIPGKNLLSAKCIKSNGMAPAQFLEPEPEVVSTPGVKTVVDDTFGGLDFDDFNDGYDDDELAGMDEMSAEDL